MQAKRPSLLNALALHDVTTSERQDTTTSARQDVTTSERQGTAASQRYNVNGDADVFRTTVYIPRRAHEQLRGLAYKERKKVSDVIVEAIDAYLRGRT